MGFLSAGNPAALPPSERLTCFEGITGVVGRDIRTCVERNGDG
jgi:hypothetical protein